MTVWWWMNKKSGRGEGEKRRRGTGKRGDRGMYSIDRFFPRVSLSPLLPVRFFLCAYFTALTTQKSSDQLS